MYQHLPSPVKFREDINGLRAWAVVAVLLFHFSLIGLPGGFAGVDVFFVISGYLMTAIIVGGHQKGNFSIWKFYRSRVRRILPVLMLVISTLLFLGWFWLPTPEYQNLGVQSAYAIAFLSNIHYWSFTGYFDSAAKESWLLHTWSLAVEAQFYAFYPIFIALLWRFFSGLKPLAIALLLILIASLVLNLVATYFKPSAAFYLLPARAWELALGGLVYLVSNQSLISEEYKKQSYWIGWVLVIGSFLFIEETFAWPGYFAIFPVVGTALIIIGNKAECKLTNNFMAQWLGDRSYSIYLWHWPLVVALSVVGLQNNWSWVVGAFVLSLMLAHISYKFVEIPTRQYLSQSKAFKEILVVGLISAVIGISAVSIKLFKFNGRFSPEVEQLANDKQFRLARIDNGWCFYSVDSDNKLEIGVQGLNCYIGDKQATKKAILFGDSFAGQYEPFWDSIGKDFGIKIHSVTTNWCLPSEGTEFPISKSTRSYEQCLFNRSWLEKQKETTSFLILGGYYSNALIENQLNGLIDTIKDFSAHGVKVILMPSPKIYDTNIFKDYIRSKIFNKSGVIEHIDSQRDDKAIEVNNLLKKISDQNQNVYFINRESLFSNDARTVQDFLLNGVPYSTDGTHISILGAQETVENFRINKGIQDLEKFVLEK